MTDCYRYRAEGRDCYNGTAGVMSCPPCTAEGMYTQRDLCTAVGMYTPRGNRTDCLVVTLRWVRLVMTQTRCGGSASPAPTVEPPEKFVRLKEWCSVTNQKHQLLTPLCDLPQKGIC